MFKKALGTVQSYPGANTSRELFPDVNSPPRLKGPGKGAVTKTQRGELHGEGCLAGVVVFSREPNREETGEISNPISFPTHLPSSVLFVSHVGQSQLLAQVQEPQSRQVSLPGHRAEWRVDLKELKKDISI